MAIQNLQARVDQIFEATFGQLKYNKDTGKMQSRATVRVRRALGGNKLECTVEASYVARTLKEGLEEKGTDYDESEGTFQDFGEALVEAFRADRRYSGPKDKEIEYKAGTGKGTVKVLKYTKKKILVFELSGFRRNDASFARANHTISQKLMDSNKFKHLFQGGQSRQYQEMAHEKTYGIVETKHRLIKDASAGAESTYEEQRYGDVKTLPQDPIRTKLKNIQDLQSDLILGAEHDIYIDERGKIVGTTTFKGKIESKVKNQKDAKAQAELGKDLKRLLEELQETIEKEYKKAKDRNAPQEELNSRPIVDLVGDLIVMSPAKRRAYASGRAVNNSKYNKIPKGKSPTKAQKKATVRSKRQTLNFAGPTGKNTAPRVSPEKGGEGKEDFAMQMRHLLKVKNAINKRLPAAVRANMGRPALISRTGRFSNSVNVESIMPAAQTLMVKYNYRLNPYETFENKGRYRWPTGYNPKPLISKSIRELALGLVAQKLTIRRS